MFCQVEIYSCFIELTQPFTIAVSNESGLKSGRLKYSDIFVNAKWKLFLPLQCKSNDIKKDCLTKLTFLVDCIYKMYLKMF